MRCGSPAERLAALTGWRSSNLAVEKALAELGEGGALAPKYWQMSIVAATSLLMALLAGVVMLQQKRSDAQVEIEAAHSELELALATLSVRMASIATGLERADNPSPSLFTRLYADVTRSATRVHERAIAFMPEMSSVDRLDAAMADFTADYAAAGYPAFRLFPESSTGPIFPAVMVEPDASRPNIFGYNMGSSPARLTAAREALARGVMTISEPVTLTQDADLSSASFLLLYPVYFADPDPTTGASRRRCSTITSFFTTVISSKSISISPGSTCP